MNNKAHLRPKDFDSSGDIIPMSWKEEKGDLIIREALKNLLLDSKPDDIQLSDINFFTGDIKVSLKFVLNIIDNTPAVYDNPYSDGREDGYIEGYEAAKSECEPQGDFTGLERKVIADAINYLLGAELLEENGYTEDVINALKSALQKLGAEEDHL